MGNIEHYFENMLYHGVDYADEVNTKYLSPEVIDAVQTCASYMAFSVFDGEKSLQQFLDSHRYGVDLTNNELTVLLTSLDLYNNFISSLKELEGFNSCSFDSNDVYTLKEKLGIN